MKYILVRLIAHYPVCGKVEIHRGALSDAGLGTYTSSISSRNNAIDNCREAIYYSVTTPPEKEPVLFGKSVRVVFYTNLRHQPPAPQILSLNLQGEKTRMSHSIQWGKGQDKTPQIYIVLRWDATLQTTEPTGKVAISLFFLSYITECLRSI